MHATVRTRALPLTVDFRPRAPARAEDSGSEDAPEVGQKILAFRNPALGGPRSAGSSSASACSPEQGKAVELVRRRVVRTRPVHREEEVSEAEQQNVVQQNVYIRHQLGPGSAKNEGIQVQPGTCDACCQTSFEAAGRESDH